MKTWDPHPEHDLEHLAKWLPAIEGRGLLTLPQGDLGQGHVSERALPMETHEREIRHALRVLDRLGSVAAACGGRVHVRVLTYCYLMLGTNERVRLGRAYGGLDAHLGLVFAERKDRIAWMLEPARTIGLAAAQRAGERLRYNAEECFREVRETERRWVLNVQHLRDSLERIVRPAVAEIEECKRVRESARVRSSRRDASPR